jgi:Tfp pilus assembly protein PilO
MASSTGKSFNTQLSTKHQLIDKANTYLIVSAVIATVVVIFSVFASVELVNKMAYQNKVIGYRNDANKQLDSNISAVKEVQAAYLGFESATESMIGTPDKNSKITLDALPSKYDFPAFITSLEYIVTASGLTIGGIEATDDELNAKQAEINPKPIEIPFSLSATGTYDNVQKLLDNLQRSIRPFKILDVNISGESSDITIDISGLSYYQPSKELGINEQIVKSDKEFKLEESTSNTSEVQDTSGGTQQ